MNIKQLQQGLAYCGKVEAVRQTYHVFQAKGAYLVLSFARSKDRKGSGYFNLIAEAAVDYVQGRMGGHSGVTANDVVQAGRRTKHITGRLQALNILYVMVALNRPRSRRPARTGSCSSPCARRVAPRPSCASRLAIGQTCVEHANSVARRCLT